MQPYGPIMTGASDRIDYTQRMHRVLEYIDKNLDRTLELAEVAQIAISNRGNLLLTKRS